MQWWCAALGAPWVWRWRPYPGVWLFIALLGLAYWRLAGRGATRGQRLCFGAGLLVLWSALDWPLGALGGGYLASVHMVQFLLIGIALAMFFLILVALAEHMGFATAYILASSTVVVINTLYCAAIMHKLTVSALVGAVLTAIYGILYLILRAEDFALLGGTLLLVVALTVTMYFTRRIHETD